MPTETLTQRRQRLFAMHGRIAFASTFVTPYLSAWGAFQHYCLLNRSRGIEIAHRPGAMPNRRDLDGPLSGRSFLDTHWAGLPPPPTAGRFRR